MENYITHLSAKNIGIFESLEISFNKKFNFIVGPNGCGKTSILRAMALALSFSYFHAFRYGANASVWFDTVYNDSQYRVGFGEGFIKHGEEYRHANLYGWISPPNTEGIISKNISQILNENINITPLILGAYRRIEYKQIPGMNRQEPIMESRKRYADHSLLNLEGGTVPNVKQWMINRYFQIDKSWANNYKKNWDWILSKLSILSPNNCTLTFKEIREDLEPIFTLQGIDCYLEEISAGFQAILSLVFAIVEWIESTNDEGSIYIPDATGTVIVDELDVHLHPEWQLTIRKSLAEIFPNLQFIFTTHSPHIIASAEPGELIILPELSRNLNVAPTLKSYSGWNTDEILEEIMGVRNLENKKYATLINEAMYHVEQKDINKLREDIIKLKEVTHPSNTIVQVLSIKMAELELECCTND